MNLLAISFVEILKDEWLGIVASAFILVSFLMTNQTWIRLINMVGCVAFVVYGMILPAYSTAFMNAALFIVHIVYLSRDFLKKRKAKNAEPAENIESAEGTEKTENDPS